LKTDHIDFIAMQKKGGVQQLELTGFLEIKKKPLKNITKRIDANINLLINHY